MRPLKLAALLVAWLSCASVLFAPLVRAQSDASAVASSPDAGSVPEQTAQADAETAETAAAESAPDAGSVPVAPDAASAPEFAPSDAADAGMDEAPLQTDDVVVVGEQSAPEGLVAHDPAFTARPCGGRWTCYVRR